MLIDLHIHTEHSLDGDLSPEEIVKKCSKKGIDVIAVTDHNSVDGVDEAIEAGVKYGVKIIPGIEIDTSFIGKVFHLLGYYIDHKNGDFIELQKSIIDLEMRAFPLMVKKLNELGFSLTWEMVLDCLEPGQIPSEELLADIILNNPVNKENSKVKPFLPGGEKSGMPQFNFYRDILAPGRDGFVPRNYITLEDAVRLVKRNGGVPVLAHPGGNIDGDYTILDDLKETGIAGFEAFSSYHSRDENDFFLEYCRKNELIYTCGSDFHGRMKKEIALGDHKCTIEQEFIFKKLMQTVP